jgi:septal ring factor EnvC (AmiA/AmiB activator)
MGIAPAAVKARARRSKWPKRHTRNTGEVEVSVPGDALAKPPPATQKQPPPPAPDDATTTLADAVRAALAPLQAALERETADRRTLQTQADALREKLAAAQVEIAQASGNAATEQAKRLAAETRIKDLELQLDALKNRPARRWWRPW